MSEFEGEKSIKDFSPMVGCNRNVSQCCVSFWFAQLRGPWQFLPSLMTFQLNAQLMPSLEFSNELKEISCVLCLPPYLLFRTLPTKSTATSLNCGVWLNSVSLFCSAWVPLSCAIPLGKKVVIRLLLFVFLVLEIKDLDCLLSNVWK